jgi:hypothetical protein
MKAEKFHENGTPYSDKIRGLQRAIRKLPDAGSYTTRVVVLGNTKNFTPAHLKKLVEGYLVDQFPHDRIYKELLFPVITGTYFTDPNLTIEINLANLKGDSNLDYDVKAAAYKPNIKLLFVPTREIGRIMHTYKNSILKFNPRSYLEVSKNKVNQEIEASILNTKSNEFALFNNGITIIADGTSISSDTAKQGTAQVVLRNPQLVNGGQTAYTLARVYERCVASKDFKVFTGKEVLLRVITFVGAVKSSGREAREQLILDISKASNSQTKVEESDRRSNDPVQLRLQERFFEKYGLYYERKRGEFSDGILYGYLPAELIVNRERLVHVALACEYRVSQARSSVSKHFANQVELASLLKLKDVEKYAYGYEVLNSLERKRKHRPKVRGDRYHKREYGQALRYGQYSVVAVCANQGRANSKPEAEAVESVLQQWTKFETWAEGLPSNRSYKLEGSFDYANYYKGSTINSDLQKYKFSF